MFEGKFQASKVFNYNKATPNGGTEAVKVGVIGYTTQETAEVSFGAMPGSGLTFEVNEIEMN